MCWYCVSRIVAEADVDISGNTSNHIDEYMGMDFDLAVAVCHNVAQCSLQQLKKHHNFPDPAKAEGTEEDILDEFRKACDQIKVFTENMLPNGLYMVRWLTKEAMYYVF